MFKRYKVLDTGNVRKTLILIANWNSPNEIKMI